MNKNWKHPYDTALSSGLRFLSELIAWIAGPWAAGTLSTWLIAPALVLLVGLPSVFSTINDKRNIIVPTPGPARIAIEMFLYGVAAISPWYIWSTPASVAAMVVVAASIAAGVPRFRWLLRGARRKPYDCESLNMETAGDKGGG